MLVTLICQHCKKEFQIYPSRIKEGRGKYCSKKCYEESTINQVVITCKQCGKEFSIYKCYLKRGKNKYCSHECAYKAQRKPKIKNNCIVCGKEFYFNSKYKNKPIKHCSMKCKHISQSKIMIGHTLSDESKQKLSNSKIGHIVTEEVRMKLSIAKTGDKSSTWRGGISFEPYCPKFNKTLKRTIRYKFNHKCFICDKVEDKHKHCIHHIDYNKNAICNGKSWALIPLCKSCHSKTNHNRYYWFNLLINYWAVNKEINFEFEFIDTKGW